MKSFVSYKDKRCNSWFHQMLVLTVLAIFLLVPAAIAAADVSYFIFGRVLSVHQTADEVESVETSALPGVTIDDPESPNDPSAPVPLPGVTIYAYNLDTNTFLGKGQANREGFYNLSYMAPAANHNVRFMIYLEFADGGKEFIGEVNRTPSGNPIEVNSRLFSYEIQLINKNAVKAGTAMFSPSDEFMFIEVGDLDMDDIYDEQQDPGDPSKWGLTKPTAEAGSPPDTRTLGPGFGFGRGLELYGLFGETSGARYYRINYSGPSTGSIQDKLYKKNYVIVGTGIEVYRVLMGPKDVTIGPVTLNNVYEVDERVAGECIPVDPDDPISLSPCIPGKFFSSYWTEIGLRAKWNTLNLGPANDGKYTLSVEMWDNMGNPLPASPNNYATLSLHLVNTPPESNIHNIQYLDGSIVLSDAAPCQTVLLNKVTTTTDDDNLQFNITARHPTSGFLRNYNLLAWYGHNTFEGEIDSSTTPAVNQIVVTPGSITYQSCAYRFRLRVWPKITNGYHIIYVRDDNWYAAIKVHGP